MRHPIEQTPTHRLRHMAALVAVAFVLNACGATPAPGQAVTPEPMTTGASEATYALTVEVRPGETLQTVERRHGGTVVVWEPQHGFAVLASDSKPGGLRAQNLVPENNQKRFLASGVRTWMSGQTALWAEGQSSLWSEGQSTLWSEGQTLLWAEGQFRVMPQNSSTWDRLRLKQAHGLAHRLGRGVKVAVLDTGADLKHPMLRNALVPAADMWDFVGNDAVPQEVGILGQGGFGHGTNVAGIVLQMAPAAKIMPLRVLGPDGSGNVIHLAAAITWAVNKGAKVINLSLGSDTYSPAVEAALRAATSRGVLIVSSAGNRGSSVVSYPASHAHIDNDTLGWQRLSVTSVGLNYQKSGFANYGTGLELAAPGERIFGPAPGNRVAAWTGTSMAAPMASGALALALGQTLSVPARDLGDRLYQSVGSDLYNNDANKAYADQVGKGNLDLESFLNNSIVPSN